MPVRSAEPILRNISSSQEMPLKKILSQRPDDAMFQALDNLFILCYTLLGKMTISAARYHFLSGTSYLTLFRRKPCIVKII